MRLTHFWNVWKCFLSFIHLEPNLNLEADFIICFENLGHNYLHLCPPTKLNNSHHLSLNEKFNSIKFNDSQPIY